MKRTILCAVVGICGGASTLACAAPYAPPTADQPHAVLKLRRSFEQTPGARLKQHVHVDDALAYSNVGGLPTGVQNDAVLVHPVPMTLKQGATFFHTESRLVTETYTEQVPYQANESYSCGTYDSPRTCNRMVTRYRSETRTRQVTKQVEVVDGACFAEVRTAPAEGAVYLLQFTYQGHQSCTLKCYQQLRSVDGKLDQRPCPAAPPAE